MANEWKDGFCNCFSPISDCFMGCCCPCILYGQAQQRFKEGIQEPDMVNSDCMIHAFLLWVGFSPCLQFLSRKDIRSRYKIKGDGCQDCLASICCPCCDVIQQSKEVKAQMQPILPQATDEKYQAPPQMNYQQ